MTKKYKRFYLVMALVLLVGTVAAVPAFPAVKAATTATVTATPAPTATPTQIPETPASVDGVQVITGSFTYTNDFYPEEYAYEHAVSLIDMTGFVTRDREWEMPVNVQVLGYLDLDAENNTGTYRLPLPILPKGALDDVDNNTKKDTGVQIFAVEYSPNWLGSPYYAGDDVFKGWPGYLASVKTDSENEDEVTGGKLVIWSPDDKQQFPTGFGTDGLLFTADDPVGPVAQGYSIIDLDKKPFEITRDAFVDIMLYEPEDVAIKDFSTQTYTEAFQNMFDQLKKEYAFNGIIGKAPDWDAVYAEIYPRIEQAETDKDAYAYFLALRDFSLAFQDGHVSLDGGDLSGQYNSQYITGGLGFAVRELDNGKVIVVYVLEGGPAATAGMEVGAEITKFGGKAVSQAIGEVAPFTPQSTDFGKRFEQTVFLTRGEVGTKVEVIFTNPGGSKKTANLTMIQEMDSLYATYLNGYLNQQTADDLPIEYKILDSGVGYVKVNSNSDDLQLAYRLFERAMKAFTNNGVTDLIIDMRLDFGGTALGLAGYFTDQEITMGQLSYYSETTKKFEAEGDPETMTPMLQQYSFDKMLLLVDQFCYSACELEAYGLSQVPGMIVAGQFPSAGVEAETARGQFSLPEDMTFTAPTGRFTLSDGSIFLEGKGVVPTVKIPVDADTVLATDDAVLKAAEEILTQ